MLATRGGSTRAISTVILVCDGPSNVQRCTASKSRGGCMRISALVVALALALSPVTLAAASDDLSGLWKAKRRFGPDSRGTLIIERRGDSYTADLAGWPI